MLLSNILDEKNDLLLIRDRKDHIKGQPYEYDVKDGFSGKRRGWVYLDSFSLGALRAVYNGLNEDNKAKFNNIHISRLLDLAWKYAKV